MNKRIVSLLLALLLLVGFIPNINVANAVETENITLRDLLNLDSEDSIFSDNGVQSTTESQASLEYNKDLEEKMDLELYSDNNIKSGIYSIDYSAYKDGTTESSSAASSIVESKLKVKGGKKSVLITFKNASMIGNLSAKVNSNKVDINQTEAVDNKFIIEFKIDSLDDDISIGLSVTTPIGVMNHSFDFVINDITFEEAIEEDDATGTLDDGHYTIDTNIFKTGTTETSAASGYLEKKSNLKVEKGQYILTLNVKQINVMSNIKATVDGKEAEVDIIRNNDGTGSISFNINVLNSNILVACKVSVPEINYISNVDFNVALDTSTLKNEEGGSVEPPSEEIELPLYKNATYTIENEIKVGGDNMPESVAYLDPKSIVEVEDKSIYLTLTFNKSGFMDGRYIKLNNNSSVTRYTVVNDNNKSVIRFKISSLSDKIHISNKNRSIDEGFTIVLLTETLVEKTGGTESDKEDTEDDDDAEDDSEDDELEDGTYTIKNKALKENSNATSDARGYLDDESIITVKNGKIYLTLKFTHGKMMSDTSIKVEGKKTSYTTVKNSGNKYHIKFKIGSLSDEILVTSTIDTGIAAIGTLKGTKFRVLLRENTLEEDDDADEDEDEENDSEKEDETVEDNIVSDSENNIIQGEINNNTSQSAPSLGNANLYKRATYKVNNEIVTDSAIGYQAARSAVNVLSYYEIENETNHYITLGFNQTDIMGNIRLSTNGSKIDYDIVSQDKSKKTMEIRFKVPSLSSQITVTSNITAMGRDISFGVKFLESTLELISLEESESQLTNNLVAGTLSSGNSSTSNLSGLNLDFRSDVDASEDNDIENILENINITSEAKEYFKRYTANNEVLSDSAIGRTMARKYLNETSIIEEIDGKLYATITFSSANSMGNFKIEVGGTEVPHSVVLDDKSNGLISLRFPIASVNDNIRVYIYIKQMKMNINFGIKFLEDTMILIEEGTVDSDKEKVTSLAENLSAINYEESKNDISVWKIAILTAVLSTILNFTLGGIIYLIIRRKKRNNEKKLMNSN